jgi:hypothetical protein
VAQLYDQLLRRSFRAGGQPAGTQVGDCSRCPWVTAGDRSFPPVLARMWHERTISLGTGLSRINDRHCCRSVAILGCP